MFLGSVFCFYTPKLVTIQSNSCFETKANFQTSETSVTEYQQEKQKLRQSFVEIDSEVMWRCEVVYWVCFINIQVKREKEQRVRQESTLAEQLEERTREKYQLLDQMLNSQAQRIDQLIREQEEKSENLKLEYGQLDQKLTTSLRVYILGSNWNFSEKYQKLLSRFC